MREREKRECGTGITRGGVALGDLGFGVASATQQQRCSILEEKENKFEKS